MLERNEIFRNIHKGQRAFIACNGPSLNDIDFSLITEKDIIFGLNRGYLKKDMRIDYLVSMWHLVEEQFGNELINVKCKAFFSTKLDGPNVYRLHCGKDDRVFVGDITKTICGGHTVTYPAIEIAYFMGFKEVYLIGCDHYFDYSRVDDPTKYNLIQTDADLNHFSPEYFSKGTVWAKAEPEITQEYYKIARIAYELNGRKLINASTKTALAEEYLPRVDFYSLF